MSERSSRGGNRASESEGALEDGTRRGAVERSLGWLMEGDGVYVPPHKRKDLHASDGQVHAVEVDRDEGRQRANWELLRRRINGLVNKVSVYNIRSVVIDLFKVNIIRGRGLLCRSLMRSQAASPLYTPVYAALVAAVNTKVPEIGELLLMRLIEQFRKSYRRKDRAGLLSSSRFIAHLANQYVCGLFVPLQIVLVLLERPTTESVEIAVPFVQMVAQRLGEASPKSLSDVFDRFRAILNEGMIDKHVEYLIENAFAARKRGFEDFPAVPEELCLVDEDDQVTHEGLSIDEDEVKVDVKEWLNFFRFDPKYTENEQKYEEFKREVLGDDKSDSEDESSEEEEEKQKVVIEDATNTDVVNLKRAVYLTIMSSRDHEEVAHKLLKMKVEPGQEHTVCNMFIQCCAEERTYLKFYSLIAQRFCVLERRFQAMFEQLFEETYKSIHRLANERQRLLNISHFFAHLLFTDALPWTVLRHIKLSEEDTTSPSRIFIKIVFNDLAEYLGIKNLNSRLQDPKLRPYFNGLFPTDPPKNVKFAINFWTAINLGSVTEELRLVYAEIVKKITERRAAEAASRPVNYESDSESSSYSSSSCSSSSYSSSYSSSPSR